MDGIAGREAKVSEKRMVLYLATKWNRNYLPIYDEKQGEASIYGFWKRGQDAILDVRITDTKY